MKYFHKKEVEIPIYLGTLVFLITNDIEKLKEVIPSFTLDHIYGHTSYENWRGREGYVIILNLDSEHKQMDHGTIAHEAFHAANMIAENRGFVADFNNDEPIAYILDWIVGEAYKAIDKFKLTSKVG